MTTLILWRHGSTDWNEQQRVQGHTDSALNARGRAQAERAAPLLAARSPDAIVASDLHRATDTAAPLATRTGLPVRTDPRLRERCYGEWEGLTSAEIAQRFPDARARQRAGRQDLGHGIEPPADVMKRVGEALREAAEATPGGTTVVATHGGAARYGMFDLLGWPAELFGTVTVLANCHYTELRLDPVRGWTLSGHNLGSVDGTPGYE
ncbi:MAG: histidine phosphatase family protein [Micromonosporaceae bacterium]|nr:histidine phosphatase family protein [Micromonosporaceae bacterium]